MTRPPPIGAPIFSRNPADRFPGLTARDLLHLAVCHINKIKGLKTFERNLHTVFNRA